jgi:ferredoxin-NADP reductase
MSELTNKISSRHKVLKVRELTESTYVLRIERKGFEFLPGQCVNIGCVGLGINREYSSYSGLADPYLEYLIKEVPGGAVSPALKRLRSGDEVEMEGPYGLFVLKNPDDRAQRYLFVCTGTGIAPFHSFVKSYPGLDYRILHGIRYVREQYDKQDYDPDRYVSCVSREEGGDFSGRVTDYLQQHTVEPATICYLCGNRNMINEVYDILRQQGVSGSNIVTEVFF